MRARVGYKIRFDQPTHPAPGFVLSFLRGVPTPIVLEVCAVSPRLDVFTFCDILNAVFFLIQNLEPRNVNEKVHQKSK